MVKADVKCFSHNSSEIEHIQGLSNFPNLQMPLKSCSTLVTCSSMPCIRPEESLQHQALLLALLCL